MGARPTDTNLFHEPGENGGNQTCYYNGFSRPSSGASGLCSRWQQGVFRVGKAAPPRGSGGRRPAFRGGRHAAHHAPPIARP
ncbi:hypothetical protein C6Q15_01030 [Burkholderia multivorans]|uniref:Uncharacterized protein n=1 Tax=Burkholderia multivorans TaxID=87883 RepID=A0A2S9N2U8_9BURK|nr:hypothetical protein C6Q15_01030 [Burkholderia multivorans]